MDKKNIAIFFDKDGVLNYDKGITPDLNDLEIIPQSIELITYFRNLGYKIIIITNQPIVARGLISETILKKQLNYFKKMILKFNKNAKIDKIYYCPHHTNANNIKYRKICSCRKPKPGMFLKAAKDFKIDLGKSYMIGDRLSDIIAGHLAGCKTILFNSSKTNESMIETDMEIPKNISADYTVSDLLAIKDIIK